MKNIRTQVMIIMMTQ